LRKERPEQKIFTDRNSSWSARKIYESQFFASILSFEERLVGVELPIKVDLKVVEAPPAVRGDTAKGGNKVVKLELAR